MEFRYRSDGLHAGQADTHSGAASVSPWLSAGSLPISLIHTGGNGAGNGGNGYFVGSLVDNSYTAFQPVNAAEADSHAAAHAHQTNRVSVDQSVSQIAGVGGDGGNDNTAIGGDVGVHGSTAVDVIATGGNTAGNGGDGYFLGSAVHAPVAVYNPVNIAVAGSQATAEAHQENAVQFHQSATQVGGVGGHGGNGNVATGSDVSTVGAGHESGLSLSGLDVLAGGNSAGNGGDGYFHGSLVNVSFALYQPINVAVAGYGSSAEADQVNAVTFDQSTFQMAGVGGQGGNGNAASGGKLSVSSTDFGLIGSDVIAIGGESAGNGGDGHFFGSLIDVDVAIFAPINIAVAGYNSSAGAHQINDVHFDQSTTQIAGIGGDGGHGNLALGGDFVLQLLEHQHVLDHLG